MKSDSVRFNVNMPVDKHRRLKAAAALDGKSMTDFVLEMIDEKLQPADRTQSDRKPIAA